MKEDLVRIVDDADIHFPCVEIDSTIIFVLFVIESHIGLLGQSVIASGMTLP